MIGVCLKNLTTTGCLLITLEDRDWSVSSQYTGLTHALYQSALDTKEGMESIIRTKENLICFASSIASNAFTALGVRYPPIINLPKLLRTGEAFPSTMSRRLEDVEQGGDPMTAADVRSVINGMSVPRMLSRIDWMHRVGASFEGREELPVIERNLEIDTASVNKVLLGIDGAL